MAEIILTDVDEDVLRYLKKCAARNGRTPSEEAKAILAEAMREHPSMAWEPVDATYHRLAASGHTFSDSADLLREDRDR